MKMDPHRRLRLEAEMRRLQDELGTSLRRLTPTHLTILTVVIVGLDSVFGIHWFGSLMY